MERQEYPKILYRKPGEPLETVLVNNEQEHEAAKLEGWGAHPSTLPEPGPEPEPEPAANVEVARPRGNPNWLRKGS